VLILLSVNYAIFELTKAALESTIFAFLYLPGFIYFEYPDDIGVRPLRIPFY